MSQMSVSERKQEKPQAESQATLATPSVRRDVPVPANFWDSPTLEELARAQNVQPMTDVQALFGTWPGHVDDGFEAAVEELRYPASPENWEPSCALSVSPTNGNVK